MSIEKAGQSDSPEFLDHDLNQYFGELLQV